MTLPVERDLHLDQCAEQGRLVDHSSKENLLDGSFVIDDEVLAFGHPNLEPLEYVQYTTYTPEMGEGGGHFDWHVDSRGGQLENEPPHLAKRVLSGSLVLEGPEEGGVLEVKDAPVVPQTAGSAILFPSLNTSHRVTPVTRGRRVSLVGWAYEWRHPSPLNPFID